MKISILFTLLISFAFSTIPESIHAQTISNDKEFSSFYKNFDKARKKKDINWLKANTYLQVHNFDLNNPDLGSDYTKDKYYSNPYTLFEKGTMVGKMTMYEFSMQDKLYSLKTCYTEPEQNSTFSKVLTKLPSNTKLYAVHYLKIYKGSEGGRYEHGLLFAKINGQFLLVGEWDCTVG